ncbi:hypothetical protein PMES_03030 [Profundibacterium mesophilum KAUST100406-0324]|uniref:Uncharacterized protein n=1 Tax=Profundibacterium mesophilum KAUST100406-0324 TaxID=1037889 RepID=A0A921NW48_9RHOB|nr:hypothetical protein PMES_03030 [Profundibacterium mesophilum KAUST100406-0324]
MRLARIALDMHLDLAVGGKFRAELGHGAFFDENMQKLRSGASGRGERCEEDGCECADTRGHVT